VSERQIPRTAWAIVMAAAVLHLTLALCTDLSPDEAYYLAAARLGRRIVDHPPLVVWMLSASDRLAFLPVELRVRVWAIVLSFATGLGCVALARSRGADDEGCVMAAWIGSWALLPTAGGFVTTPDGPLLLAVTLALLAVQRPALSGTALLGGACAKVTALPIAALLALGGGRRRAVMWLALPLLAVPLAVPSLRFQIHHAYGQGAPGGWSPLLAAGALIAAVAAQAALWSPVVLWRGLSGLRALPSQDRALALGLSLAFVLSALARGIPPEPNWWAPAAIVMLVSFARTASELSPRARRAVLASVLVPTALAAAHTARPFLPLPPANDPTARLHGWSHGEGHADAAGTGTYGPAAERCVYQNTCDEISSHFNKMNLHE
jgi:hypothetical protein